MAGVTLGDDHPQVTLVLPCTSHETDHVGVTYPPDFSCVDDLSSDVPPPRRKKKSSGEPSSQSQLNAAALCKKSRSKEISQPPLSLIEPIILDNSPYVGPEDVVAPSSLRVGASILKEFVGPPPPTSADLIGRPIETTVHAAHDSSDKAVFPPLVRRSSKKKVIAGWGPGPFTLDSSAQRGSFAAPIDPTIDAEVSGTSNILSDPSTRGEVGSSGKDRPTFASLVKFPEDKALTTVFKWVELGNNLNSTEQELVRARAEMAKVQKGRLPLRFALAPPRISLSRL
ncbi:hypothetical protein L6164_021000 [Bauhinia variegata]|uniref:Uncharacterized protein n=1 Tax=Bauhinia variegata TaxID=167791 RepID=A0ACB9MX68_BAUVA|nr:hypothetical protein L6164_021000 [Bauhinia variegata]